MKFWLEIDLPSSDWEQTYDVHPAASVPEGIWHPSPGTSENRPGRADFTAVVFADSTVEAWPKVAWVLSRVNREVSDPDAAIVQLIPFEDPADVEGYIRRSPLALPSQDLTYNEADWR